MKRFFSVVLVLALCIAATSAAFADSPYYVPEDSTEYDYCYPETTQYNASTNRCGTPYILSCCDVPTYDGLTEEQIAKCEANKEWAMKIALTIKSYLRKNTDWRTTIVCSHGKTANGIIKIRQYNTKTGETIPDHFLFAYNGKYVAFCWEHINNQKVADYDCLITAAGQKEQQALSDYYNWVLYGNHNRYSYYPYDDDDGCDYGYYGYTYPTTPSKPTTTKPCGHNYDCNCGKNKTRPCGHNYDCRCNYSKPYYYTIQWGDTLWGLAKRFGTTVDALVSLNGIKNPNKIYAGDTIRIW